MISDGSPCERRKLPAGGIRERTANVEVEDGSDDEPTTVYVVVDHGDVSQPTRAYTRGVYLDRDAAEARRDDVNGPFKSVNVDVTHLHGGD